MKQLFHIASGTAQNDIPQVLLMRLGEKHISFAITDRSRDELFLLRYFIMDEPISSGSGENTLSSFFSPYPELDHSFYEVQVCYEFPESILVPASEYRVEDAALLLQVSCGTSQTEAVRADRLTSPQLYNIYQVPKSVSEWLGHRFPAAKCRHQNSMALSKVNATETGPTIIIDFQKEEFALVAAESGQLLLAQTFTYATPEDVVYYLLKTCRQFSWTQQDVQLLLSGLIDQQSALYKELYQYFIHIRLREAVWRMPGNEYPAHFFTSLNDLARCAS